MKIGIIGLGSIGERHARNLQKLYPRAEIDILTRRGLWKDAGKRTRLKASEAVFYGTRHDIYFITNETGKHTQTILRCLAQKPRGIFVEKPLCVNVREARTIEKALKGYRGVFFVAYCLQFFKPLVELKNIIQSGAIGQPLMMRVLAGKDMRTWRSRDFRTSYSARKHDGGVILDLIHEINYPSWLIGDAFSFVSGMHGRMSLPIASEDFAVSAYRSKKGVVLSIHQDYLQSPGMRSCEVFGENGTAIWSRLLKRGSEENLLRIERTSGTSTRRIRAGGNDMYIAETKFFIKLARKGKRYSNLAEAVRDIENVEAFKRKAKKYDSTA